MTTRTKLCAFIAAVMLAGCEFDLQALKDGALAASQARTLLRSEVGGDRDHASVTAAGTLLGAFQGSMIGRLLDRSDRPYAESAARRSLETSPAGVSSRWTNPGNGHTGTFTPFKLYKSHDDLLCRDYEQTVTIAGRTETAPGTACREENGSWRVALGTAPRALHKDRRR